MAYQHPTDDSRARERTVNPLSAEKSSQLEWERVSVFPLPSIRGRGVEVRGSAAVPSPLAPDPSPPSTGERGVEGGGPPAHFPGQTGESPVATVIPAAWPAARRYRR